MIANLHNKSQSALIDFARADSGRRLQLQTDVPAKLSQGCTGYLLNARCAAVMLPQDLHTRCDMQRTTKTKLLGAARMAVSFKSAANKTTDDLLW